MSSPSSPSGKSPSLQELRASRGARPSFARRNRGWLIAGGVVLVAILFGFFGLPPIVKAQAVKRLSERLGRAVSIERVRINPLVLSTTVEGLSIAESDPAAGEFAGWRRLYVNFDSWSLLFGEIGFQDIELDGFRGRVAKGADGGLNFNDIVERVTAPDPATGPGEPADLEGEPTPLAIGRLAVTDAQVAFSDASLERSFATVAGPLTFTLEKFRTVGDPDSPYQFEAVTGAGERLAWKGTVSADPIKSQGELVLTGIDLARLSPYYHRLVAGELRSAFVDVAGKYTFELKDGAPALTLADGTFTLRDLRFGAPGVEADALSLKRLAVGGISADSVALAATIDTVALEGVQVKATRDAGGIDLLRLVAPQGDAGVGTAAAPAGSPAAPSSSASTAETRQPVVKLRELSVAGVQVEVVDLTTPRRAEHRIEDLAFTLTDLDSADLAKALPLTLEIKLPMEGRVAAIGTVGARPLAAELDLALERVPFANASPYLEPFLNIRLAGGVIRARGKATMRGDALGFAGDFGVAEFRAVDGKLAQDFVKWTDFAVTGIRATTKPLAFHAEEIRFVEPDGSVRVEADGTLSIAQAAPKRTPATATSAASKAAPAAAGGAGAEAPLVASVGKFMLERAAFRFEDRSVRPTARGGIVDFGGTVTGLSSETPGRGEVELRGKVDGTAPVAITGRLDPLGRPAFLDLKVDFKNIDLQAGAGPYIGKFAGRELARGNLSVAVAATLKDRKLDTDNVVTFDQFYLGAKTDSPEATKLPVGLALALLRDAQGKIVIDLPVKGSLDDPSFKVGRVVVRVLTNILTKAATSPFSLLGAAFGGGGDELGWQDFPAGVATPDEAGIKKLETVAKALNGRPALNLDLVGAYDPARDRDALRRVRLEQELRATAWETRRLVDPNTPPPELIELTPQLRAGMLAKLYAAAFPLAPGEAPPVTVIGEGARSIAIPVVPAAEPEAASAEARAEERPRRQVGRLPRFGAEATTETGPAVSFPVVGSGGGATPDGGEDAMTAGPTITVEQMASRLAERIEIREDELRALAEARAQAVRGWLIETGRVPAARVFMEPVKSGGARVDLNLK